MSTAEPMPTPRTAAPSPSAAPGRAAAKGDEPLLDPEFLHKLEQLELVSRKIIVGRMKGERKSRRRGTSVEFAEHRNYTVGDDLRHIDWNVYGRLDRLFLKLFLEEEDLHVYTLLDTSVSMNFGTPTKLRYGKQVAAALAFIGLVNQDRVILDTFASRLDQGLPGIRGRSQMWRIVDYLDRLAPSGESDLKAAAKEFAIRHAGKGIVVVISDFLDKHGYEDALRYLLARKMDIFVIHLLSREEVEPELVGDLRLVDSEDDEVTEITMSAPLLKRYKDNLNAFVGDLKEWCTRRGITYIFTTNQLPFDKLVLNYLRERGLVK
ncbi:hypothetical protein OJF2_53600 [Aquisphaera giovannonii]|uniref:DUF58 domain-containing protein n=1 Tax=Aquisphaera giovannonii TaxID=406548 RepID=A0A5B9W9K6_9BACT|nr:DUF58 domain-containing protein [Aquisphaera giovannonii]QEH36775.1 hypothetical protein OJF2_53600 [Aquisphaera giovannonii]